MFQLNGAFRFVTEHVYISSLRDMKKLWRDCLESSRIFLNI